MALWGKHKDDDDDRDRDAIIDLLQAQLRQSREEVALLRTLVNELSPHPQPQLSFIKIHFGDNTMPLGPLTIDVGQKTTATVQGFDQNGAPFTGPIPTPTWSIDNAALDSSTPQPDGSDIVASLAAGTANLTASVAGPTGPLTDTETITNVQPAVLTAVKINFSTPA